MKNINSKNKIITILKSAKETNKDILYELKSNYVEKLPFHSYEIQEYLDYFIQWCTDDFTKEGIDGMYYPPTIYLAYISNDVDYLIRELENEPECEVETIKGLYKIKEYITSIQKLIFCEGNNQDIQNLSNAQIPDNDLINNPIERLFKARNNIISLNQYLQEFSHIDSPEPLQLLQDSEQELNLLQRWFMRNENIIENLGGAKNAI